MTPKQKMATAVRATVSSVSFVLLLTFLVGGVGHKVNDLAFESNNAWLEFWSWCDQPCYPRRMSNSSTHFCN